MGFRFEIAPLRKKEHDFTERNRRGRRWNAGAEADEKNRYGAGVPRVGFPVG